MAGLFDIFTNNNAQDAANAQKAGLGAGFNSVQTAIGQGNNALSQYYNAALAPFLQNQQTANSGVTALGNVLGLNGQAGNASATQQLENTPGYNFQLNQGTQNVLRNAAQTGTLASGQTLNALQNQGQGQAQQTYNNYVSQLQPFLGYSTSGASGIAGINTGLGSGLNQNYNTLGQAGWQTNTGIGNAQANADLANNAASANMWGALQGGVGLAASIFSDVRLKEDIEPVGELYDGTHVWRYRYKGDPTPRIGLMAQEVERQNPEAVTEIGGFKAVDYAKATDFASLMARFSDNEQTRSEAPKNDNDYAGGFARFLEAA